MLYKKKTYPSLVQKADYKTFFAAYIAALSCTMDEMMLKITGNSKNLTWGLGHDSRDCVNYKQKNTRKRKRRA